MKQINFTIAQWFALSAGLQSRQDWQQWADNQQTWPEALTKAPVQLIPAMMRRRMSSLSKLAVQSALQLVAEQEVDYIVFSSRHGELTRTASLLQDVIDGHDASPMAFSQSVHNTASGLFTIASKRAVPVNSIAACENSLPNAMIEAYAYLQQHPTHKVLLVDFDEPLPAPYEKF